MAAGEILSLLMPVQSACQRVGVEVNGEKYGCGWRATKRADGWQEEGCRNAHPSDTRS